MNLQTVFNTLGLKNEHLKVYLASLEWGETIITNLARKSGIARTTVYLLIKDLIEIGLITQTMQQGASLYAPAEPEYILSLLNQKKLELDTSTFEIQAKMNQLKAIHNNKSNKPKVEYLQGVNGIKQAYKKTFEAQEIWIQCLARNYDKVVPGDFFDKYFAKFFKETQIKSKEILRLDDEEYSSAYASDKNLQLRVPVKQNTETDFWVYDDKVTFVSFNIERPYALIIQDADIASSMRNMYDLAWQKAAQLDPRIQKGEKLKTEF